MLLLLPSGLVGDKETSSRHLHSHYTEKHLKNLVVATLKNT